MRLSASSAVGLCLLAAVVTAEDKPAAPAEEKITYEQHILPIFREKCGSCHNGNDKKGDLVLDNYGLAMQGGASGEVVRGDGDASQSQLYLVVTHQAEPKMPPQQPKLPDEQLNLIRKWIEGGALENSGSKAKPKKNAAVAKVTVSNQRPAGPPPMPENLPLDPEILSARGNGVTALAANPWSTLIAVAGHKQVAMYDTRTRDLVGVLSFPEGVAHVLKFSRDGQWLLAGGGRGGHSGKVVIWDIKTGKRVTEVGSEYDIVLAADVSPDHSQVALGGPKKIVRVYDTSTGELLYEKNKHTDWITSLEFSPDGVLLASADRSNGLVVWEAFTGREFYVLTGHTGAIADVSWSPDSNVLASCSEDTTIRLWEMQNGGQIKNWGAHGGGVTAVEYTRDGRIASTGRDNVAKLWDGNGGAIRVFPGLADIGMEVAFDSDSDQIIAGDLSGAIQFWNAKDAVVLGKVQTNPPPLVTQLELTSQNLVATEQAAQQAAAALPGLTKAVADHQAAAAAAQKVVDDVAVELDLATKFKTLAEADGAAKTKGLQGVETNLMAAEAANNQAVADRDASQKQLADLRAKAKAANEAITAAENEQAATLAAYEAKSGDANLKAAYDAATKKLTDSLSSLSELSKQLAAAVQDQTAKVQVAVGKTAALVAMKARRDKIVGEKAAADDVLAKATGKHGAVTQQAAAAKAVLDKANADAASAAKQLADTDAAGKAHVERIALIKAHLERLNAAKGRKVETLEASVK